MVFATVAEDDNRLVLISPDSSLLAFETKNVHPRGCTAGGMADIKLAKSTYVAALNMIPAGKAT